MKFLFHNSYITIQIYWPCVLNKMKGLLYYTSEMYTSTNYSITFRLAHQFSLLDKKKNEYEWEPSGTLCV